MAELIEERSLAKEEERIKTKVRKKEIEEKNKENDQEANKPKKGSSLEDEGCEELKKKE